MMDLTSIRSIMTNFLVFKPLSKDDVAEVLGVSVRTIENWVSEGTLLAPVKFGGRVYWHPKRFFEGLDRRLSGDDADGRLADDAPRDEPAEPVPVSGGHVRAPSRSSRAEHEREKLRRRNQEQLDALSRPSKTES
jgi:excisionase family DNA binding protein